MPLLIQFLIGLLFGSGLVIAGMSDPAKVLNFLDVAAIPAGTWDPSLAFVMAGGILVTWLGYRIVFKRGSPLFADTFHIPANNAIQTATIVGPAMFGIGWGLVGFCPGPAFTALGTGAREALIFTVPMLAGMVAARQLAIRTLGREATAGRSAAAGDSA